MSEKSIVFNAALIEDPLRNSQISRPSNHSHHVAIHPKRNESIWSQIWATRDALYDPHNDAVNLIKATLKGAVLGAFFGTTLSILFKNHPTFVLRKAMRYIYNTNYGSAILMKEIAMPYTAGGAAIGASYWIFWNYFWRKNSANSLVYDMVVANSVYGALVTPLIIHPRYWWAGMWVGGILGFTFYHLLYSSNGANDSGELPFNLSGRSEEDRKKQHYKDYIYSLTFFTEMSNKKMIDL